MVSFILFFWNFIWMLSLGGREGEERAHLQSLTEVTILSGKDLGLAFEIPPHIRNQALFAACVLKVTGILQMSKMIINFSGLMSYLSIKCIATYSYYSFLWFTSIHHWSNMYVLVLSTI